MPSDGVELSPHGDILTNDEIMRLSTLFVKAGVTKIRLTGGEPTVRKGILDIIGKSFQAIVTDELWRLCVECSRVKDLAK